jgi:hypothetical protein
MTMEVLNETQAADADRAVDGPTTSAQFNLFMPVIVSVFLWVICRMVVDQATYGYVGGFVDGAFAMFFVRAASMVVQHYRARGGSELADARHGLMIGLMIAGVLAVTAAIGVLVLMSR